MHDKHIQRKWNKCVYYGVRGEEQGAIVLRTSMSVCVCVDAIVSSREME